MHAITGCATVSQLWGIGKATALKILNKGHQMSLLGTNVDLNRIVNESTQFIAQCYGRKVKDDMSRVWYHVWLTKTAMKTAKCTPKLHFHLQMRHFRSM